MIKDQIEQIKKEFESAIDDVRDFLMLEEIEQRFFARKNGKLTDVMKGLKDLSGDAKKEVGQLANIVKTELQDMLGSKREELDKERLANLATEEAIDVSQQVQKGQAAKGHIHPITQARWELEEIARNMGFLIEDGPELESDYYNFGSLNFPEDHPARESMDSFYVKDKPNQLMRAHISNMQVRLMRKYGAPLRAAHPGRVFRNETIDATHGHTFYQFDALVIDKDLSVGDLIGTIMAMFKGLYKKDVKLRIRPGHFPFVEPGFEIDMQITYKAGDKIKTKWMEIVGCGMIHPNVLREGGIDPEEYNGYAFDYGIDRIAMSKYGIEDIRHIHGGDLRFLTQF
ncbi:MAG: phenylalanine--tRNA ligase subunit alpha [Candidatus Magasanikbacteria bacterium]|jgi:phenylalanyl-tRNA synthetase alpha chain|nr:phenylalanine--tRNA ligase subunit alpha [Candidatus Magasanikbacteria bacterium]